MDIYLEQSTICTEKNQHKKKRMVLNILRWAFLLVGGVILFIGFFILMSSPMDDIISSLLIMLPGVAFVAAFFFAGNFMHKLNMEFDFVLNGNKFIIVKVINRAKRKKYRIYQLDRVTEFGKIESETYDKAANKPGVKKIFAVTNGDDTELLYYMVINDEKGVTNLVHLELETEMQLAVKKSVPIGTIAGQKGIKGIKL